MLPFAIFLVVPILGRMSDHHPAVRHTITQCFATLLQVERERERERESDIYIYRYVYIYVYI